LTTAEVEEDAGICFFGTFASWMAAAAPVGTGFATTTEGAAGAGEAVADCVVPLEISDLGSIGSALTRLVFDSFISDPRTLFLASNSPTSEGCASVAAALGCTSLAAVSGWLIITVID